MGYKKYKVDITRANSVRSSTDGYQPKFLVDGGKNFLKVQCVLGRTLRDDWRVEDIASRICRQLGIYAVIQTPCNVEIKQNGRVVSRLGVVSDNFENEGHIFVSYNRLVEYNNCSMGKIPFENLNAIDKLKELIVSTTAMSGIGYDIIKKYFFDMVTVDLLVLNQDRHFRNFGVFFNNMTQKYEVARLFDFGMGLFENDTVFDDLTDLTSCLRYSYIAPFGEDPFDLAKMLLSLPVYREYLRHLNLSKLKVSKELFIHPASYMYFKKMKEFLLNGK